MLCCFGKKKKKKEKVRLMLGWGTSICPLPLYARQPPAQHQAGKMEDGLGGPKPKQEPEPVDGTGRVYRRLHPRFNSPNTSSDVVSKFTCRGLGDRPTMLGDPPPPTPTLKTNLTSCLTPFPDECGLTAPLPPPSPTSHPPNPVRDPR